MVVKVRNKLVVSDNAEAEGIEDFHRFRPDYFLLYSHHLLFTSIPHPPYSLWDFTSLFATAWPVRNTRWSRYTSRVNPTHIPSLHTPFTS